LAGRLEDLLPVRPASAHRAVGSSLKVSHRCVSDRDRPGGENVLRTPTWRRRCGSVKSCSRLAAGGLRSRRPVGSKTCRFG